MRSKVGFDTADKCITISKYLPSALLSVCAVAVALLSFTCPCASSSW
jgi:hypothetical protein